MDISASKFAPYFILRAHADSQFGISPLKLQKLLYYAQAWSLVFRNNILFLDRIEAWVHGPVIPTVYHKCKPFYDQAIPIDSFPSESTWLSDELEILDEVWNTYGHQSGQFLVELTHAEFPWRHARRGLYPHQPSHRPIFLEDMRRYYSHYAHDSIPNRINPVVLKKDKDMKKTTKGDFFKAEHMRNFFYGMGSVLDILPVEEENRLNSLRAVFRDPMADSIAISSDWDRIGLYLSNALESDCREDL
ncbi:Panacea domain-containing protein [Synechococcus sp. PCC 7336]|uniref:Panacea domain-containing protein n=1 Tax=Synechococcus sp. PCC 7336 TaxID=195250 RepID=UPI00035C73C0|nr:type II toxin-antitoxin system antitoxin SocA domain-containing protein [Synechococcus sp. PCC 7336]